jgi:phosphoribosylanthranilate isomerase
VEFVPPVKVKVCCLASSEEAKTAVSYGAAAVGFVSAMPAGEPQLEPEQIRAAVEGLDPSVGTFLLTAVRDVDRLVAMQRDAGVNTLQLWESLSPGDYAALRKALPGVSLVQAIHVRGAEAVDEAAEVASRVDALVLDSGDPDPPFRWRPQGGRTHDWDVSRAIVESVDTPCLLAGGLDAENVCRAIRVVRPYGVDVCTSVRSDGALDRSLLVAFLESVSRSHCNS